MEWPVFQFLTAYKWREAGGSFECNPVLLLHERVVHSSQGEEERLLGWRSLLRNDRILPNNWILAPSRSALQEMLSTC